MIKIVKYLAVPVLSVFLLIGCSTADEDVSTGAENAQAEEEQSTDSSDDKTVKVNKTLEAMGVKLKIGEVKVKPNEVQVGVSMENTTDETRNIFLDMDTKLIVDGKTQLTPNPFMGDTLDNEMAGGIEQSGVMVFPTKEKDKVDPAKVKEIEIRFPAVQSGDFMKEEKLDPVKVKVK